MFPGIKMSEIHVNGVYYLAVCHRLALQVFTLRAMTTYYFKNPEEALKRVKAAAKRPGYHYGGITLPSGKKGWALHRDGKVVEMYAVMRIRSAD